MRCKSIANEGITSCRLYPMRVSVCGCGCGCHWCGDVMISLMLTIMLTDRN